MQAFLRERRPIRQKVNYRCYFLIIILIQKKSPLNSNHVHVFYIHGIVIGLNLVYPWNKTAVSTIFHITIQGKSNPKRMRQKCAVQNCESYAGKCQYRLFRFPTPCPLSWLAVVGRGIWHPKKSSRICSKHFRKCGDHSFHVQEKQLIGGLTSRKASHCIKDCRWTSVLLSSLIFCRLAVCS